jgi:hypothetical protein
MGKEEEEVRGIRGRKRGSGVGGRGYIASGPTALTERLKFF